MKRKKNAWRMSEVKCSIDKVLKGNIKYRSDKVKEAAQQAVFDAADDKDYTKFPSNSFHVEFEVEGHKFTCEYQLNRVKRKDLGFKFFQLRDPQVKRFNAAIIKITPASSII